MPRYHAAGGAAGHRDVQDDRDLRAGEIAHLDVAPAHRHVVGIHHDARLDHQDQGTPRLQLNIDMETAVRDLSLGEVERHVARCYPDLHPPRDHPAALAPDVAVALGDPDQILGLGPPGHRVQVRGKRYQLARGPGGQRGFEALIQLIEAEQAVAGGDPENLSDPVPVGVRYPLPVRRVRLTRTIGRRRPSIHAHILLAAGKSRN